MPTYEYECTSCGAVFELFQPITEPPRRKLRKGDPRPCRCNARVARRIGTGGGIIFKGSGFYATDYRSDSYKKAAKSETDGGKKDKSASESGSEKKAESKPAKKSSGDAQ